MAITFTNEAAAEIRRRVLSRLLRDGASPDLQVVLGETIGTIHGFCHGLLRELGHLVGANPAFEVPLDADLMALQRSVLDRATMEALQRPDADALERLLAAIPFVGSQWVPGLGDFVHACMTRGRWLELDPAGTEAAIRGAWQRITPPMQAESASERMQKIAEAWSVPREYVDQVARILDQHGASVAAFAWLVRRYAELLDGEKQRRGWLSQDDALYHAARLVARDDVREFLRGRFEFLLVDEYQDTDPLQDTIVERLANPGCLFRVGDLKQSIYRFRSARPTIFRELVARSEASGTLVRLERNNRAVPALRDFWNAVFARVFRDGEIAYGPLEGEQPFYASPRSTTPAVEVFHDTESPADVQIGAEAAWIAGRIAAMVGGTEVWDRTLGAWRPGRYADAAVLLRVKTHASAYLRALSAAGIPYVYQGGGGFWQTREVETLVTGLQWLADPTSPFLSAAVLRSALFGVSDDALARLAPERFAIHGLTDDAARELAADDVARVRRAVEVRVELRAARDGRLAAVLERLIEVTSFDQTVLTRPDGAQAYGNIRKLVEWTRGVDADGRGSLADLTRALATLVRDDTEEPQAPVVDDRSDAVRVMTVHGSKGLEFPWVFVPHTDRKPRMPNNGMFVDAVDGQLRFWLPPPTDPASRSSTKLAEVWDQVAAPVIQAEAQAVAAEELRLLYVALTRARERLFLAIPPVDPDPARRTWSEVLESALSVDLAAGDRLTVGGTDVALTISRAPDAAERAPSLAESLSGIEPTVAFDLPNLALPRVGQGVAAGGIADYLYCPYRYFLGRELGLPAHVGLEQPVSGNAAERGTRVHEALERLDFTTGHVPPELIQAAGQHASFVREAARRVTESGIGDTARGLASEHILREFPFRLRLGDRTSVSGVVDLALDTGNGLWVVEYKTGKRSPGTSGLHVDQTRIYAHALEKALGKKTERIVVAYVAQAPDSWMQLRGGQLAMEEEVITETADRIAEADFEPTPGEAKCAACPFGGVRRTCRHRAKP